MKHLKTYEQNIGEPQIGDYIIAAFTYSNEIWESYINNQVGKIISYVKDKYIGQHDRGYEDRYEAIYYISDDIYKKVFNSRANREFVKEKDNKKFIIMSFPRREIKEFSSTIEDLEAIIAANKYNL